VAGVEQFRDRRPRPGRPQAASLGSATRTRKGNLAIRGLDRYELRAGGKGSRDPRNRRPHRPTRARSVSIACEQKNSSRDPCRAASSSAPPRAVPEQPTGDGDALERVAQRTPIRIRGADPALGAVRPRSRRGRPRREWSCAPRDPRRGVRSRAAAHAPRRRQTESAPRR